MDPGPIYTLEVPRMLPLSMLAAVAACATFEAERTPSNADGGATAVASRDLRIAVEWPSAPALDPLGDARAAQIHVVVVDSEDTSRRAEQKVDASNRGPYAFEGFVSSAHVDVVVEVLALATDRLVGYGEARGRDVGSATTVDLAARRRLLYFANTDTVDEELRVADLAPADVTEPGMTDFGAPLPTPAAHLADLAITPDARLIAVGATDDHVTGVVGIYETATHTKRTNVALSFAPSCVVAVGGHDVVAFPAFQSPTDLFARVNLDTGEVAYVSFGFPGGQIAVESATLAPGARVVAAGELSPNDAMPKPYVFIHDLASGRTGALDLAGQHAATAVRFTPDAKRMIVVAYSKSSFDDVATGSLFFFDGAAPASPVATIPMTADKTKATGLVVHPDGHRAFVSTDVLYPSGAACCGELDVFDLDANAVRATYASTSQGPEYRIGSAVRMPYGTHRVVAGLTDDGNNVHGAFVELVDGDRPLDIADDRVTGVHTVTGAATPFGTPL